MNQSEPPASDYHCRSEHVPITLDDLLPPHILETVAWPYILEAIFKELRFVARIRTEFDHINAPLNEKPYKHFGKIFNYVDLQPLIAGDDPVRDICDKIADYWVRKIVLFTATTPTQCVVIDPRWIPTKPRTFWQWLRNKPAKRLRSEALEIVYPTTGSPPQRDTSRPALISRISYVIHSRD